ncbi:MAG: hypothetical protein A3G24_00750 [Betaproteobacteria bacterium RIFCSPLOWO2_12_FULL_62_13]|nr:MAG: hypothetical protein A3G24_00750 [Betaproteobacteria bacterium RIFCSPLOWO2_12_FULL_62_13]
MSGKVLLVVPEAPAADAAAAVSERNIKAGGLRLGRRDNSKGNADHLLRFIAEGIKAALPKIAPRYGEATPLRLAANAVESANSKGDPNGRQCA